MNMPLWCATAAGTRQNYYTHGVGRCAVGSPDSKFRGNFAHNISFHSAFSLTLSRSHHALTLSQPPCTVAFCALVLRLHVYTRQEGIPYLHMSPFFFSLVYMTHPCWKSGSIKWRALLWWGTLPAEWVVETR